MDDTHPVGEEAPFTRCPFCDYILPPGSIIGDGLPSEDFAAAWASKCEELARETAKVTALVAVIRGVVEASRPYTPKAQRDEAWAAVGAITLLDEARQNEDFMDRLARVREQYATPSPGRTTEQDGSP